MSAESDAVVLAGYDFRGLPMGAQQRPWRQVRDERRRLRYYRYMVGALFVVALVWICVRVDGPAVIMAPVWAAMIALTAGGIVAGFVGHR